MKGHAHNTFSRRALVGILLMLTTPAVVIAGNGWQEAPGSGWDPFEPTVTTAERALLIEAMDIATTNVAQAIHVLSAGALHNASPALDFAIGNFYVQDEAFDAAVTAYQAALEKNPRFRSAILNLGRVHLIQERAAEAIRLYQRTVSSGQADAAILLLLGHALLMENEPVSAESAYRQSLLLRVDSPEAKRGLARALLLQGREEEGLALVGELLRRDPDQPDLWALRANACLSLDRRDEAMRAIEVARRLGWANAEMLATLGDLFLNQDQPEDASRAYEQAFAVQAPSVTRMLRAAEGFLMMRDTDGAAQMIAHAEAVRERDPGRVGEAATTRLLRLKAELAQQEDRLDDARTLGEEVLMRDPLDGRMLLVLAALQEAAGERDDAIMTAERAARVKGFEADALIFQARIEVQRERLARAVSLLEAALAFENRPQVARYLEQVRRMID